MGRSEEPLGTEVGQVNATGGQGYGRSDGSRWEGMEPPQAGGTNTVGNTPVTHTVAPPEFG